MKRCPIKRFEEELVGRKILDTDKVRKIREEAGKEIEEAVEYANQSPFPDPQDVHEDVYASILKDSFGLSLS